MAIDSSEAVLLKFSCFKSAINSILRQISLFREVDLSPRKEGVFNGFTIAMLQHWNDLRYVLAIARSENIAAAVPDLDVHESTVLRRLNALEKQLGARLFDRFGSSYVATPAGEEVCRTAAQMEENIHKLDRQITDQDLRPSGTIRVTTSESA